MGLPSFYFLVRSRLCSDILFSLDENSVKPPTNWSIPWPSVIFKLESFTTSKSTSNMSSSKIFPSCTFRRSHMVLGTAYDIISYDIPFTYYPCARPASRPPSDFPFFGHREDWPYKREQIGGWTLTPFGGRGRFRDRIIEIEGLVRPHQNLVLRLFLIRKFIHSWASKHRKYTRLASVSNTVCCYGHRHQKP